MEGFCPPSGRPPIKKQIEAGDQHLINMSTQKAERREKRRGEVAAPDRRCEDGSQVPILSEHRQRSRHLIDCLPSDRPREQRASGMCSVVLRPEDSKSTPPGICQPVA